MFDRVWHCFLAGKHPKRIKRSSGLEVEGGGEEYFWKISEYISILVDLRGRFGLAEM